jgi:hypothetical protein
VDSALRGVFTLRPFLSGVADASGVVVVGDPARIHLVVQSALRPCGRDMVEIFKSTSWAFLGNLTSNSQLPDRPSYTHTRGLMLGAVLHFTTIVERLILNSVAFIPSRSIPLALLQQVV